MGYQEISFKLPTDYTDEEIRSAIKKELSIGSTDFSFQILHKSLDARKKNDIHWLVRVGVLSDKLEDLEILEETNEFQSKQRLHSLESRSKKIISSNKNPETPFQKPELEIPYRKRAQKALVVGSGPAGFFAAYVLQKAGFHTTLIERGSEVTKRATLIKEFETTGKFNPIANYAFGEGGAGTFSDGKLTSRSKHINKEKQFVLSSYVEAGAPEEILYMAHPHLGSDHLKQIVKKLRASFINIGGTVLFETMLTDIKIKNKKVVGAVVSSNIPGNLDRSLSSKKRSSPESGTDYNTFNMQLSGVAGSCEIEADELIIAPGHSAYETYRMLMTRGVAFKSKSFAIGCRVEHPQELINIAQWGKKSLPGVKAAEYRLTSKGGGDLPVYTFCMCPGGVIVPSTAYENTNIVNGMSRYKRNEKFANSACVAGINLSRLLLRDVGAEESLEWLASLEHSFYSYSGGYAAPFCTIQNFIDKRLTLSRSKSGNAVKHEHTFHEGRSKYSKNNGEPEIDSEEVDRSEHLFGSVESSYPLGLKSAPLWELFPSEVSIAIRRGLKEFSRKLRGFETGLIMGLESKTSSPVSVLREKSGCCTGFDNLYMAGEGSGHSGGIISSASDGIRAAISIIIKYNNNL